jgi:hypothetical protein
MINGEMNKEYVESLINQSKSIKDVENLEDNLKNLKAELDLQKQIKELYQVIDFDKIEKNSVIIVKIGLDAKDPSYSANLQLGIIKNVVEPRLQLCKEKNLTILFMAREDSVEVITEEQMKKAGWLKKNH